MSEIIQFPPETGSANVKAEAAQTITLLAAVQSLPHGGATNYTSIAAWKQAQFGKASAYIGVVLEFSADAAATDGVIGDGTMAQAIGLFGEIDGVGKFLLGLVGVNFGNAVPQVPIDSTGEVGVFGFAQVTANISLYDKLSVGGVFAAISTGAINVTCRVRPIRDREYVG